MEIERKFLVINNGWKQHVTKSSEIIQFYLTRLDQSPTVRLRLIGDRGILTLKYPSISKKLLMRDEFEYDIPKMDVEAQLNRATGEVINKVRHEVTGPDGMIWEVDEFTSPVTGLILAEIELESPDQTFRAPSWLGEEVTRDPAYSNISLSFGALSKKI
ncbi:MAG: CYTH domain-containing protein [Alphaproteobacteria bacterium]|nr:MAG: CYTH domain-containing protein [Alphaproteobacteria bacterium]